MEIKKIETVHSITNSLVKFVVFPQFNTFLFLIQGLTCSPDLTTHYIDKADLELKRSICFFQQLIGFFLAAL